MIHEKAIVRALGWMQLIWIYWPLEAIFKGVEISNLLWSCIWEPFHFEIVVAWDVSDGNSQYVKLQYSSASEAQCMILHALSHQSTLYACMCQFVQLAWTSLFIAKRFIHSNVYMAPNDSSTQQILRFAWCRQTRAPIKDGLGDDKHWKLLLNSIRHMVL